jgi:hypothetical protein
MVAVPALVPNPVPIFGAATTPDGLDASLVPEALEGEASPRLRLRPPPSARGTDDVEIPVWDPDWDVVDQWGAQSFPASDPPANW